MTKGRLALTAFGVALSVLAIVALLRAVRAADLAEHLRATRLEWLAAGLLLTAFGYVLRAYRWRALLAPQRNLPFSRVFGPTVVGFLAINTLPARLGEFVRAYLLARSEGIPTAGVLGSCALERVLDLGFLALFWGQDSGKEQSKGEVPQFRLDRQRAGRKGPWYHHRRGARRV